MNRQNALKIIIVLVVLLIGLKLGHDMFRLPTIPPHRGDGQFQDFSRRVGPIAAPGYSISMPEFDLSQPHRAEYRLAGLTTLWRECGVHLAIRDPDSRWWETGHLDGLVQLELLDSQGESVMSVTGRLGDYTWWGTGDLHILYQSDRSFFKPNSSEEYRLRLSYQPDSRLAGYKGFVYLRSGGYP